jgi:hypothetical protein
VLNGRVDDDLEDVSTRREVGLSVVDADRSRPPRLSALSRHRVAPRWASPEAHRGTRTPNPFFTSGSFAGQLPEIRAIQAIWF